MLELLVGLLASVGVDVERCAADEVPDVSNVCYWDAREQGNGEGNSFLSIVDYDAEVFLFITNDNVDVW